MPDTLALSLAASSDAAVDKALALAESYLKPEMAEKLKQQLRGIHLEEASLKATVDAGSAGRLAVEVTVSVTPPG